METSFPLVLDTAILKAAVDMYLTLSASETHFVNEKKVMLSSTVHSQVEDWLDQNHPAWIAQFNMDLVEWILKTYHGAQ